MKFAWAMFGVIVGAVGVQAAWIWAEVVYWRHPLTRHDEPFWPPR